jgi:hypothetical protein
MLPTRPDPPPGTLAHGPVTASRIEHVRMELTSAERTAARHATRYWQRVLRTALKELEARSNEPRNLRALRG